MQNVGFPISEKKSENWQPGGTSLPDKHCLRQSIVASLDQNVCSSLYPSLSCSVFGSFTLPARPCRHLMQMIRSLSSALTHVDHWCLCLLGPSSRKSEIKLCLCSPHSCPLVSVNINTSFLVSKEKKNGQAKWTSINGLRFTTQMSQGGRCSPYKRW